MPPIIIAFWIALSAALGPPLVKGLSPHVDSNSRPEFGDPAPVLYRTWTSSPTRDAKGNCTFTVFALVTRNAVHRLRINGQEQLLDWSWSFLAPVPKGMRGDGLMVEFLNPVGGDIVATHEISEVCEG